MFTWSIQMFPCHLNCQCGTHVLLFYENKDLWGQTLSNKNRLRNSKYVNEYRALHVKCKMRLSRASMLWWLYPNDLKFFVCHPMTKIYFHAKFQLSWSSSFWVKVSNVVKNVGKWGCSENPPKLVVFWSFLQNYCTKCAQISCGARF